MARIVRKLPLDSALASFVSLTLDDLEHAMSAPPEPGPYPVRTLADMSRAERRKLERHYGCKIGRRRGMV